MKKIKNILLLTGICIYIFNAILEIYTIIPSISSIGKPVVLYLINRVFVSTIEALIIVALPIILLCLNIKNKYSKVFSIIVTSLNVLASGWVLFDIIDSHYFTMLQYFIFAKLGLENMIWGYHTLFIPDDGLISFISLGALIMITVGAIISCKNNNAKKENSLN